MLDISCWIRFKAFAAIFTLYQMMHSNNILNAHQMHNIFKCHHFNFMYREAEDVSGSIFVAAAKLKILHLVKMLNCAVRHSFMYIM